MMALTPSEIKSGTLKIDIERFIMEEEGPGHKMPVNLKFLWNTGKY